jgi:MtN3 and saliva related transmembrane protein
MTNILAIITTITGIIMSFAYFPQALKILKNRSVKDVSLTTFSVFFVGIVIWLVYGISIKNIPIVVANIVGLIGCGFVLIAYFVHRK